MYFTLPTIALVSLFQFIVPTTALGINCRGSGFCKLASWQNKNPERVMQALRDAIWASPKPNSTAYTSGAHVICLSSSVAINTEVGAAAPENAVSAGFSVSGKINSGGICVFPQLPSSTGNITLGLIRGLSDKLLEHGCGTCGSVPVKFLEGSNDPGPGILTYNYVKDPSCTGSCIGADGNPSDPNQNGTITTAKERRHLIDSAKFRV